MMSIVIFLCVLFLRSTPSFDVLVVFQNDTELRPTGGFMGSYAHLRVQFPDIELVKVEDIYTPDGQLDGHVDPPEPIARAFGQGWYRLRDSNFDPDGSVTGETVSWFFTKGGEPPADVLVFLDTHVFQKILEGLGTIEIPDEAALRPQDFLHIMQSEVELGFFPGSIQKPVYLGKVARASLRAMNEQSIVERVGLLPIVFQLVREKHLFLYSRHPGVQAAFEMTGLANKLPSLQDQMTLFGLNEANLGTNKANCCIDRSVQMTRSDDGSTTVVVTYTNHNPENLKRPPYFWGGKYVVFLRVMLPLDAQDVVLSPRSDRIWIERRGDQGLQLVGFFVEVDAQSSHTLTVSYRDRAAAEKLYLYKQPGVISIPFVLRTGKSHEVFDLRSDQLISL